MRSARHILIVNGRKVQQPVFIIGAPHSGAHLLARALKRADAVHQTIGQSQRAARDLGRRPLPIHDGRGEAPRPGSGRVRPGLADHPARLHGVRAGVPGGSRAQRRHRPCAIGRGLPVRRANPDRAYCAEALTAPFRTRGSCSSSGRPRRGRVHAADSAVLSWFSRASPTSTPSPRTRSSASRPKGPDIWLACRPLECAMRWRGAVRLAARLRRSLPAEQLITVRYETLIERPPPPRRRSPISSASRCRRADARAGGDARPSARRLAAGAIARSGRRRGKDRGRGTPPRRLRPVRRPLI